ncbi:MAG: copper-binding protein [Planctomycetota bacterium]|jgi:Cu/Ag efflux protein CusF|nr:copper-binding protein [Planctomycetota bacterium]
MKSSGGKTAILILALAFSLSGGSAGAGEAAGGHGGMGGGASVPAAVPGKIYTTTGRVEAVDREGAKITVAHGAIPDLKLPAMSMRFNVDDPSHLEMVKPGDRVRLDFRGQGDVYTIVDIEPL